MSETVVPRILVFDSGVGGLSVAARVHEKLPDASIIYLADNAAFPYGGQPESVVIERCCALIVTALEQFPCDVVVIACNTASTVVLPSLRSLVDVPVVGVVPAVKPAAAQTLNHRIGLLATPATVRRLYLDQLVREFATGCQVERVGHPGLVQWAENLVRGVSVPQDELDVAVASLRDAGVDTVVLGCTHYPLLLDSLRQSLPDVKFWVDSGEAIARRVSSLLVEAGLAGKSSGCGHASEVAALFSGNVPEGIVDFMMTQGLPQPEAKGNWPGSLPDRGDI
ncbi:glutamate racemase [Marinobacter sp. F3R11]|uniref:glutamate racemase n=1 Tax=Marinobacter sp. F3R11 TaxID=2267231 RepID=UPI000DE82716|nr:glutamate racemase [Marinobacter sp. F3R11]RBW50625.1 glutamate racemase [Marinobacter sp. F3R11]